MLAIEVEYLMGRVVATDPADRTVPEWPPHPQRLFSAMVAAAEETGRSADADLALAWIESQPPPSLTADAEPRFRDIRSHFVPVNDQIANAKKVRAGKERIDTISLRGSRSRQERFFPAVIPHPAICQFVWKDVAAPEDVCLSLQRILREVTYVGHSSSPVRATLVSEPGAITYEPAETGEFVLRVPGPGRLARLRQIHEQRKLNESIQPPAGRRQRYRRARLQWPSGALTHLSTLRVLAGPKEGLILGLEPTVCITRRLREALLSKVSANVPEELHGHAPDGGPTKKPHIAIVPLANVDHSHADGSVKGYAILVPRDLDASKVIRVRLAAESINRLVLRPMGELSLEPVDPHEPPLESLNFFRPYQAKGNTWTSVTPVALDQHPKKGLSIESIVKRSAVLSGFPEPHTVELSHVGMLRGTPPSTSFARQHLDGSTVKQLATRQLWHLRLRFPQTIMGPLLLGSARFLGLGLFRVVRNG